jgi:hypothetical protein
MAANAETLTGDLSGEAFLRDFKTATEMARAVDFFESWILAGNAKTSLVEQVKQNPVIAEEQLSVGGLASLLAAKEEQERMEELVEEARRLNIVRFLGYKATVTQLERGSGAIRKVPVSNTIATGSIYNLPGTPSIKRSATQKLTSISPATESFRIGEYRSRILHFTAFWDVHPFDNDTGEAIIDVAFQGQREGLPSRQYQQWWAENIG